LNPQNTLFSNKKKLYKTFTWLFLFLVLVQALYLGHGVGILPRNTPPSGGPRLFFFIKLSLSASPRFRPWDAEAGCGTLDPSIEAPFGGFFVRDPLIMVFWVNPYKYNIIP